ncbi:MAG: B12-binding domain-containing radical SAM protein [Planctomycetaceae bacterium]|nr:B12-binding domain-containing radical SAM protein [Planctomycetaceae bacterium]
MRRRKLVLVNPVSRLRAGFSINRSSRFPPLGLGVVASLTPPSWDVELVDENFEEFTYRDADLVGITAFTSSANRAYETAQAYRDEGIPVVMGGIHASMCQQEALQFVDAIVVGEVESVWAKVLEDAVSGTLQSVYQGTWQDLTNLKHPQRDIFHKDYVFGSIQTSRGCPLDCNFCSVTGFNGRRYRRRLPAEVLDELETIPQQLIFFVDDNIIGYGRQNRELALELFKGMVERGIEKDWFCQASVNIADDPEILEWAGRAGCRLIFLGIEAEDVGALGAINKRLNLKRGTSSYEATFDRIHAAGIAVLGAFIFGIDGDTPETLYSRAEYMINSGVDVMQATAITPLPGTRVFQQMKEEGRLLRTNFPHDWDRYNLTEVVFQPTKMGVNELSQIMRDCVRRIWDIQVLKAKAKRTLEVTGRWETTQFAWKANLSYRDIAFADCYSSDDLDKSKGAELFV